MSSNKLIIEEDIKVIKHAKQIISANILKGIYEEYIEDAIRKQYYLLSSDASIEDNLAGCS